MTRSEENRLIWRHTHPDYRGTIEGGFRCILVLREGGTTSIPLDNLTDAERADKLAFAIRKEARK